MLFTSLEFFVFLPLALAAVRGAARRAALAPGCLLASYVFYGAATRSTSLYLGARHARRLGLRARRWPAHSARAAARVSLLAAASSRCSGRCSRSSSTTSSPARSSGSRGLTRAALPRLGITTPVGYSVLRLLGGELSDRRLRAAPARRQRTPARVALYLACFPKILAGPIERATTFLPQLAAGLRADPEPRGARAAADRLGAVQEGRDRRQPRADRRPGFGIARLRIAGRPAGQRLLLRVPDLLRLLRLHRHRDRRRAAVRLPADGELPPALSRRAARPSSGASAGTSRSAAGSATTSTSRSAAAAPDRCAATSTS